VLARASGHGQGLAGGGGTAGAKEDLGGGFYDNFSVTENTLPPLNSLPKEEGIPELGERMAERCVRGGKDHSWLGKKMGRGGNAKEDLWGARKRL